MTSKEIALLVAPSLLLAVGLWMLLPRGTSRGKAVGLLFTTISLGLFAGRLWPLEDLVSDAVFYSMAAVTLASAIGAVTMRSPVYCAIWFALTLLGTAGLFFFQGAQFLGVATIVVYAGAILVTFLFVLMLSSPEGNALYDRLSWEAFISAATGAVLVCLLTWTAASNNFRPANGKRIEGPAQIVFSSSNEEQGKKILSQNHVEKLGAELFSRHLAAVEVGGTLLLVALVGAIAVASHGQSAMEESRDA
ncbi:MAG: NADH-quinone oxidoreductase subunit J [Planctomycetia bacterium]|nr:NADH-quinone oxidoreductase subunit J [Planctomycetia bacterium]